MTNGIRIEAEFSDFLPRPAVIIRINGVRQQEFRFALRSVALDWDNDGVLDLNYLQAPATAKGEVDSNFDGIPDVPGMTVCPRPMQN